MARKNRKKDVLAPAKKQGRATARQLFNELNRLSAATPAPPLGTQLKRLNPKTMVDFFRQISWRRAPEDPYEKMEVIFPGLSQIVKVMDRDTDPMMVFDFFLSEIEPLNDMSPRDAWEDEEMRDEILRLARAFHSHGHRADLAQNQSTGLDA